MIAGLNFTSNFGFSKISNNKQEPKHFPCNMQNHENFKHFIHVPVSTKKVPDFFQNCLATLGMGKERDGGRER